MPLTGPWNDIVALALVPIVLWLLACGYGLLLERIVRVRLPGALLVPVGFCLSIVVALALYTTGAGDSLTVPVVVIFALAGFALARHELPARLNGGWPLLAALGTYLLFNASVIVSGHWTLTGYNIANDSSYELLLISHLQAHGTQPASHVVSTANTVISQYLGTGYPLGAQSLLGVISGLLGVPAAVAWQAFISSMAGVGAMAAASLSGRTMDRRLAALAGLVAMAAALTYQYALQGAIKEIGVAVAVLCALAVMRYAILSLRGVGAMVLVAIPLAAVLALFNAAGIPYVGALIGSGILGLFFVHRRRPERSWIAPGIAGAAALLVCSIAPLLTLGTFLQVAQSGYSGSHATAPSLGPLLRQLPLSEVSGVWLYGDYRLAVPPGTVSVVTVAATVILLALLAPAVLRMVAAREPGPLMGLLTMALVLLIVYPRVVPYAQAKLLAIASPIVILCAAQALTGARGRDWKGLSTLFALGLAAAVIVSDALAYHAFPVAPTQRLAALNQVGRELGARGPVLDSEFEQFAKNFTQPAQLIDGSDGPTPETLALLNPALPVYAHSFDLDQEQLGFVESFPYVLTRRSPAASRPPANYSPMLENAFYALWRRAAAPRVYAHLPLGGDVSAAGIPSCAAVGALVHGAPPGSHLAVALARSTYGYELATATTRSPGWVGDPHVAGGVLSSTPGRAQKQIQVTSPGEYELWVQGDLPRRVTVTLDGRSVGSAFGTDTPGGWLSAGEVRVSAGAHLLGVERGGGDLRPGNGSTQASIDAVALSATQLPQSLKSVPLGRWRSLCGAQADWVEVVG